VREADPAAYPFADGLAGAESLWMAWALVREKLGKTL